MDARGVSGPPDGLRLGVAAPASTRILVERLVPDDPQVQVELPVPEAVVELLGRPQANGHVPRIPGQDDGVLALGVVRQLSERRDFVGPTRDLIPQGYSDRVWGHRLREVDLLELPSSLTPDITISGDIQY